MYNSLDVIKIAEECAKKTILKDRAKYYPYIEVIEQFISKNEIVIGGKTATQLLLHNGDSFSIDETIAAHNCIEVFISEDRMSYYTHQMADLVYAIEPNGLSHYTTLSTFGTESVITVNGRDIIRCKSLLQHKGVALADMVIPTKRLSQFTSTLQLACMGPEVQLIMTYQILSDPSKYNEWTLRLNDEKKLRKLLLSDIKDKIAEVTGGRKQPTFIPKGGLEFWNILYEKFLSDSNKIVVGHLALEPASIKFGRHRLQLISSNALKDDADALIRLGKSLSITITTQINEPKVPIDMRLRRLTGYIENQDGREAFIDIFNSAQYELIPWIKKENIRVGTPFVIMRFRLVDIWTMQFLLHIKVITTEFARGILHEAMRDYEKISEKLHNASIDDKNLFPYLDVDNKRGFIGHWEDAIIAQKRISFRNSQWIKPYYPCMKTTT